MNQKKQPALENGVNINGSITVAKNAGFCFGVKRAVEFMDAEIEKKSLIYSVGELIHNRVFNERLKKNGVRFITRDQLSTISEKDATVFIRAHGEQKDVLKKLSESDVKIVNATCPFVTKIHDIVSNDSKTADLIIIIGDRNHPEIEGIISNVEDRCKCVCFSDTDELRQFLSQNPDTYKNVTVVAQTTLNVSVWQECCDYLKAKMPSVKIYNTICSVTEKRQTETEKIAKESDIVIVVGSPGSSNTKKLFEIAKKNCKKAILIETSEGLKEYPREIFRGKNIGITAGASTPFSIIQEVIYTMTDLINEELSFAEMLDSTFITLNQGERVTGTISAVTPAEIHVDLKIKHTGIIPFDEVTDDSSVDLMKEYSPGDKIEAIVVKFNDSEGTVLLSKKRIDSLKNWERINDALDSGEIVNGKVKEAIKGGYIVLYDALRVFVPASQSGVPMNGDANSIVGKTVPMKIIEVNKFKKRVIGSIKQASRVINKQQKENFFATAEVGQKFTGTVRSIVPYGVFVDLGGVDGMVHISQLTWNRIKDPSEVVKVGQKLDVYIREIDKEKKRISLGCKLDEDNPWTKFETNFKVGDVIDVKVVNLFPFGAFAEIIPGVDGLIHISQVSDKQLKSVSEVLNPGDVVKVKITAINSEENKVSLSTKALLNDSQPAIYDSETEQSESETDLT